ncbi:MAG TPA: hydroxymethylbilane synthase [Syntrophales bacterium]|nr:hydroxymethylbilane synthase [Syntrophales bacterium]HOU77372.1 hydroxymethylbilane synthase [Syntrophales bacterium]HPC32506.1 hydroxymethylbilane synthase [Syntrophales bacterium]HQG34127.1 hydroxymethylbilane synthase [Syntrophales bacterium]HQI35319.1 hydroxymethylbilane synthase [Syntrophales bacterium]
MISGTLRIGTRGSALALAQAGWVKQRIERRHPGMGVELVVIKTKGDIMQDVALVKIGGKGVFVKEIEDALLRGDIDLAVHSLKDVPAELPPGLTVAVTPEREDPRDVFVSKNRIKFEAMPRRARIGTGSLRRGFQLRNIFPDVEIVPLRGNLDTRLRKVETEDLDAVVVAAAGIRRLGWVGRVTQFLPVEIIIPAVGQGTLAIEVREDDDTVREYLAFLNHDPTWRESQTERAFLRRLGGGCQLPLAAHARTEGAAIKITGLLGTIDGRVMIREELRGPAEAGVELGAELAETILRRGGRAILDMAYRDCR